jgi:hypothetical protein
MQCGFAAGTGANDMQWPRNHVVGTAPDTPCVSGIAFADRCSVRSGANGGPDAHGGAGGEQSPARCRTQLSRDRPARQSAQHEPVHDRSGGVMLA